MSQGRRLGRLALLSHMGRMGHGFLEERNIFDLACKPIMTMGQEDQCRRGAALLKHFQFKPSVLLPGPASLNLAAYAQHRGATNCLGVKVGEVGGP